jgi:prenyltransferase beta subunit
MRSSGVFIASVWLLASPLAAQPAKPQDQDTINFISALRNPDGGYAPAPALPGKQVRSSLRATAAAIRALKYLGGELMAPAATAKFVESCYDKASGGFGDFPGEAPNVGTTAVGIMTIVELNLPPEPFRNAVVRYLDEHTKTDEEMRIAAAAFEALQLRPPRADAWLRQIAATRNADGTFGTGRGLARATGGTAVMILRLGGKIENRDAVVQAMRAGQRPDGGFGSADRDGSDLESTYRVVRAFAMLKEKPAEAAQLQTFVAKCRAKAGGYGVMPGQPPTAAATYYAAIVSHWLDQLASGDRAR